MMFTIPKGHYSENGLTVRRTTQVGFGYGWYQPKYQGRGLKERDDG